MSGGDLSDKLGTLISEFERSTLRVLHIRRGSIEIHLSKDPVHARTSPAAPTSLPRAPAAGSISNGSPVIDARKTAAPVIPDGSMIVRAPNIGTFYRSPKPGAPPYVEVGQSVAEGQEICLIEVMKLFTALRSEFSGKITAILVEDGTMVEADQPLFAIEQV